MLPDMARVEEIAMLENGVELEGLPVVMLWPLDSEREAMDALRHKRF